MQSQKILSFCLQKQSSYDTVPPPKGELLICEGTDCHNLCKEKLDVDHLEISS